MNCQRMPIVFKLNSGLHIGDTELGFIEKTRYFAPSKNLWAMVTKELTNKYYDQPRHKNFRDVGFELDYKIKFTNFYLWNNGLLKISCFDDNKGLLWDGTSESRFVKDFIATKASTAIDMNSSSAQENMLHELEFIKPVVCDKPVFLVGEMFFKDDSIKILDKNIPIKEIFTEGLKGCELYLGGKSNCGFGNIQYIQEEDRLSDLKNFKFQEIISFDIHNNVFNANLKNKTSLPCFLKVSNEHNKIDIKGDIELITLRECCPERGTGNQPVCHGYYWKPGSIINSTEENEIVVKIAQYGYWELQ